MSPVWSIGPHPVTWRHEFRLNIVDTLLFNIFYWSCHILPPMWILFIFYQKIYFTFILTPLMSLNFFFLWLCDCSFWVLSMSKASSFSLSGSIILKKTKTFIYLKYELSNFLEHPIGWEKKCDFFFKSKRMRLLKHYLLSCDSSSSIQEYLHTLEPVDYLRNASNVNSISETDVDN